MRLVSIEVDGFKRFSRPTSINVDGPVVAIVGPNEAGKTSLLKAIDHLRTNGRRFRQGELTRNQAPPNGPVVAARFLIQADDLDEIGPLPGSEKPRWYVLGKGPNGRLTREIEPADALQRDLGPRKAAQNDLERAAAHPSLNDEDEPNPFAEDAAHLARLLDSSKETLTKKVVQWMQGAAERMEKVVLPPTTPKYIRTLPERLRQLAREEATRHPLKQALAILDQRCPTFHVFGAAERDLRSDYDLTEVAVSPPPALANLTRLAGLDLVELRDSQRRGNYALAEKLLEDANSELRSRFEEAWNQSGVYVRLRTDDNVLRVFVAAADGYTSIAERSDGLLAFLSLLTFTALHSDDSPIILLIDEAENHLHYDAQADLIKVFAKQQAAEKVIYTTHSAGCLPNDLSRVRLVAAHEDGSSSITNAYWAEGPGLNPLLVGMGASVLAFTPARRAVFAEGGTDAILIPALFRAILGLEELDFQVVPGLSEVSPPDIPRLDLDAAAVAYLVDGDAGGGKVKAKLLRNGVPPERIVVLGGMNSKFTVEDYVSRDLYADAVEALIERRAPDAPRIPRKTLRARGRCKAVKSWCKAQGVSEPNKVSVAYEILDLQANGDSDLVQQDRQASLKETYGRLANLLHLEL